MPELTALLRKLDPDNLVRGKQFVEREGHLRIPSQHREDGYNLGSWVRRQRTAYQNQTIFPEHEDQLEKVTGWVWDTDEAGS